MTNGEARFCVGWDSGPSAQLELFSPAPIAGAPGTHGYQVKYAPPFRTTFRPPVGDVTLGPGELGPIRDHLGALLKDVNLGGRASSGDDEPPEAPAEASEVENDMVLLGQMMTMVIPAQVRTDLFGEGLFVELGLAEKLLTYPWELMNDGNQFLCLTRALGRIVIAGTPAQTAMESPTRRHGSQFDKLSVLIVSVPNPQPREVAGGGSVVHEKLPEAEAETQALVEMLCAIEGVDAEVIPGRKATFKRVYRALTKGSYHILHFNGHAYFNPDLPYCSSLVLHDRDMSTGHLKGAIGGAPPLLCFINACEAAKSAEAAQAESRLDVFSLARAILDTGSYLLGSRWKVKDETAKEFAKSFYGALVGEGKAIGTAVLEARKHTKTSVPDDPVGWATYVYYGDPRLCIRPD